MDDVSWRRYHGRSPAGRRHVPPLAANVPTRCQLLEYGRPWSHWSLLPRRRFPFDLLVDHHCRRPARNLDIPSTFCRRRLCEYFKAKHSSLLIYFQVDSFIPGWDWDIKKKKGKKEGKSKKSGKKSDGSRPESPEGLAPPKMAIGSDSDTSRPSSARGGATIEEVPDEDD